MERINYSDFDKSRLDYYGNGFNSDYYLNERKEIFKIFKDKNIDVLDRREKVLDAYEKIDSDYISKATTKIMKNDVLIGYGSKFLDGDKMSTLIKKRGMLTELKDIIELSKRIERIHNNEGNPVIGDINFDNIIVEGDNNPIFINQEDFGINGIKPETISSELYHYCTVKDYDMNISQDSDRLALLLAFFYKTFGRNVIQMREFMYNDYKFLYPYLEDCKEVYEDIISNHKEMPKVPYLHSILKK